jgi:transposase-like protein
MKTQRRFRPEFKRQIIEELLNGISCPAQIMRRYEISSGLLYHWKKQYAKGSLENPPDQTATLEERVRQLEQLFGKLTLENEFLKKAVQRSLEPPKKSANSLPLTGTLSKGSKGVRADGPAPQHLLLSVKEQAGGGTGTPGTDRGGH